MLLSSSRPPPGRRTERALRSPRCRSGKPRADPVRSARTCKKLPAQLRFLGHDDQGWRRAQGGAPMSRKTGTAGTGTAGRIATLLVLAGFACALVPALATAADPIVAAAGNIACDATSPYFNNGAGTATRCHQAATARLASAGTQAVLALGSNQYCCGSLPSYQASYDRSWGAVKPITHPVPASRDYATPQAAGYFDYFNGPGAHAGPAGLRGLGYY